MERISVPSINFNWIGHIERWPRKGSSAWKDARTNIFESHKKWARSVALKVFKLYRVPGAEIEDYLNYANIGLLESIDNYNPSTQASFRGFAFKRIKGAVLNGITKYSEFSYSSNWMRRLLKERMQSVANDNQKDDGADLVENIIALTIGFVFEDSSLDQPEADSDLAGMFLDSQEIQALHWNIKKAIDALPELQRKVMHYHYYEYKSFTEVAELCGCTVGRVSQMHAKILANIRKRFEWE